MYTEPQNAIWNFAYNLLAAKSLILYAVVNYTLYLAMIACITYCTLLPCTNENTPYIAINCE